ncbi:hypothetical protein AgCh_015874 [Apium graveolens]
MDLYQCVLVVPFPAQGHVMPLIKLAYNLAYHGIDVMFANCELVEAKILAAMSDADKEQFPIRLVTYSDGMESQPADQRSGQGLRNSLSKVMPGNIENLIKQINHSDNREPITCVIADLTLGWTLEVASKMGLKQVAVWPAGPACLALSLHIPKLISTGVIDETGSPVKNELIRLSNEVPVFGSSELMWSSPDNPTAQKFLFDISQDVIKATENGSIVLCNTFLELDSSSCALIPNILPIGPLPAIKHLNPSIGTFSPQDSTCLNWLDKQPSNSVIYIAFGSTAKFIQKQFNEVALGLELSGHSFLWVIRSNIVNGSSPEYPDGFLERTASLGKIVEWAPQEKLQNKNYIRDMWKVGLSLEHDEDGMISRHEIKTKIDSLLTDEGIKRNALKLMEDAKKSVNEGGSSYENFESLIKYLKA